jgi:hypothetical protein
MLRHKLLFPIFILFSAVLPAQSWVKVVGTSFSDVASDLKLTAEGNILLSSKSYNTTGNRTIYQFNGGGNELLRIDFPFLLDHASANVSILPIENNDFWISGYDFIQLFDKTGAVKKSMIAPYAIIDLIKDENSSSFWSLGNNFQFQVTSILCLFMRFWLLKWHHSWPFKYRSKFSKRLDLGRWI